MIDFGFILFFFLFSLSLLVFHVFFNRLGNYLRAASMFSKSRNFEPTTWLVRYPECSDFSDRIAISMLSSDRLFCQEDFIWFYFIFVEAWFTWSVYTRFPLMVALALMAIDIATNRWHSFTSWDQNSCVNDRNQLSFTVHKLSFIS